LSNSKILMAIKDIIVHSETRRNLNWAEKQEFDCMSSVNLLFEDSGLSC
jgi:hypothetical protein